MTSYTGEQIKRWCTCSLGSVASECPLHGTHIVEWQTFCREITLLESEFEPMGLSFTTEEYPGPDALERAQYELASIQRYDSYATTEIEYQLRYRLIGPWVGPRA